MVRHDSERSEGIDKQMGSDRYVDGWMGRMANAKVKTFQSHRWHCPVALGPGTGCWVPTGSAQWWRLTEHSTLQSLRFSFPFP